MSLARTRRFWEARGSIFALLYGDLRKLLAAALK
jgi:hypothetical protein